MNPPKEPSYEEQVYAFYEAKLKEVADKKGVCGPHCDALVLHPVGTCQHCDDFPALHEARDLWKINHTGEYDKDKLICPAEARRNEPTIHLWPGNRPSTET